MNLPLNPFPLTDFLQLLLAEVVSYVLQLLSEAAHQPLSLVPDVGQGPRPVGKPLLRPAEVLLFEVVHCEHGGLGLKLPSGLLVHRAGLLLHRVEKLMLQCKFEGISFVLQLGKALVDVDVLGAGVILAK